MANSSDPKVTSWTPMSGADLAAKERRIMQKIGEALDAMSERMEAAERHQRQTGVASYHTHIEVTHVTKLYRLN
jgi:hypothetical protein